MAFLAELMRFAGLSDRRESLAPLYRLITGIARDPDWYRQAAVPDNVDGRFEMVALILSLVLLRLEAEGEKGAAQASLLTEIFIADMDGQMRESGIGDAGVGMRMGKVMSALGGRLAAYRTALQENDVAAALARNLYRAEPIERPALDLAADRVVRLAAQFAAIPFETILAGRLAR